MAVSVFYPSPGGSVARAKSTCRLCIVRLDCLNYAVTRGEAGGIWGGMSEEDRHTITRGQKA